MPLLVFTARLPHHGCPGYTGPDRLDVTRGSGGPYGGAFAPSRELLDEANRRKKRAHHREIVLAQLWAWYAPLYLEEMRASWVANRAAWHQLLARDVVTLCCYCGHGDRCHRRLLAEILAKLGAVDMGER